MMADLKRVALAKALDWTLIVPIGTDDAYGLYGYQGFVANAKAVGIDVICGGSFPSSKISNATVPGIYKCASSAKANVYMLFSKNVYMANEFSG
jgi:hypothetical protein